MKTYIDQRLQYLTEAIEKYGYDYNMSKEIQEQRQLLKCKGCEWGTDTGTSVYCIWGECRK